MTLTDEARVRQIEGRESARRTLTRYMDLCDVPRKSFDLDELGLLFTPDAVWEGVGQAYAGKFGRVQGRAQIVAMLGGYLPPSTHFRSNVHLLANEQVEVGTRDAAGQWILQQISAYEDGRTELLCARLFVEFELDTTRTDGTIVASIRRFQTERLACVELGDGNVIPMRRIR